MINYLLLILLLLILYLRYKLKLRENFTGKQIVNISPYIQYYPAIIFSNDQIYNYIADTIYKYNPMDKILSKDHSYNNLIKLKYHRNLLALVTLYDYLEEKRISKIDNNLTALGQLFNLELTILSTKYKKISDIPKIVVSYENCGEHYLLKFVKQIIPELELIYIGENINEENITRILKQYDTISFFTSHPNIKLRTVLIGSDINIVDFDLDKKVLEELLSNFHLKNIDRNYYKKVGICKMISSYILIVTHKTSDPKLIYKIVQNNFVNFNNLKNSENLDIKESINYFNKNELHINEPLIELHEGYYKYLVDIGFIVKSDNNICRKLAGIGGCETHKIQPNPYRLL